MANTPGRKQTVGVVFGSRSVEHDVAVVTAQQVIGALDPARYEVVPIYITREGRWLTGAPLADLKTFQAENITELMGVRDTLVSPSIQHHGMITPPLAGYMARNVLRKLDVVFPVVHGTHGEDGTLQGLFELADLPYVGCGVLASAVANDKIIAKAVLREYGVPIVDYMVIRREDWRADRDAVLNGIESRLDYPWFVKPATLGSSIGIGRPGDRAMALAAIDVAMSFDRRILIEPALAGALEINCAVLGNAEPRPSVLEQPISFEEFLTYDDKYMRGGAAKGMKGAERKIPAPLPDDLTARIKDLAVQAFKAIDGRGTARIDFLVKGGEPFVNEVNTMPGSLAFYLWQYEGMSPSMLCDELIRLAHEAHAEKRRTLYDYRSGLVARAAQGGLKGAKGVKGLKSLKGSGR
ncbi:MAG: D-alanine--D-alanine ligase [Anaerolineae bacterium]|nr:D-alanine--D-alanine ligase [Anaerolineae bacterium]